MGVVPDLIQLGPIRSTTAELSLSVPSHHLMLRETYIRLSPRPVGQDIKHVLQIHTSRVGRSDPSLLKPLVGGVLQIMKDDRFEVIDNRPLGGIDIFGSVAVWGIAVSYIKG